MRIKELKKDFIKLITVLAATFAAAFIGSFFTTNQISTWYVNLERTIITPPNWVFGPAWTLLYILMAVAAFLVWRLSTKDSKTAIRFYWIQLALNALWSILFFTFHLLLAAYAELLVLLVVIIWTTVLFYKVNKSAAYLMIPYILWVTFASFLNLFTYLVNR